MATSQFTAIEEQGVKALVAGARAALEASDGAKCLIDGGARIEARAWRDLQDALQRVEVILPNLRKALPSCHPSPACALCDRPGATASCPDPSCPAAMPSGA